MTDYHEIEARIRYLTTEEGGRKTPLANGYRGQFYYDGDDHDGFQFFPDVKGEELIELGTEVRAFVRFRTERWEQIHRHNLHVGKAFQIREGRRVVGEGIVTQLEVPRIETAVPPRDN
jgi:translation elongation factor EF-Tu-like GTPase